MEKRVNVDGDLNTEGDVVFGDQIGRDQIVAAGDVEITHGNKITVVGNVIVAGDIEEVPAEEGEPPYKGLQYFSEGDAAWFFGREELTAELIGRLHQTNFLAVVGASGSGKSSLVRAGVVPRLQGDIEPDEKIALPLGRWQAVAITPTAQPLIKLAEGIFSQDPEQRQTFYNQLKAGELALLQHVEKLTADDPLNKLLLVVDQFEELFTLSSGEAEREIFVQNLAAAGTAESLKVIITLRSDFYTPCLAYPQLRQLLESHQMLVGPMRPIELARAVLLPAKKGGWRFQVGLAELMLEDVGREPGALPLLSHALLETWERRRGRTLTLSGYREAGGVRQAITQTADGTYESFEPTEKAVARRLFLELTTIGREESEPTRRQAVQADLLTIHPDQALVEKIMRELAQARLITIDQDMVQVSHEALIRSWKRLRDWIEENREWLELQRELEQAARVWEALERAEGSLLRGLRLSQAQAWVETLDGRPPSLIADFIDASRQAAAAEAERQQAQLARELKQTRQLAITRQRMISALGVLALVLATLVALLLVPRIHEEIDKQAASGELVEVAGGSFMVTIPITFDRRITETTRWDDDLPTFYIEKYEVTNAQYKLCVEHAGCFPPLSTTAFYAEDKQDHPVVSITAVQAADYCRWLGRLLPTELQWLRAAGGRAGTKWPWGDAPEAKADRVHLWLSAPTEDTVPVDSYPSGVTAEGEIYNLLGNAAEWTATYTMPADAYDKENNWDGNSESLRADATFILKGGGYGDTNWVNNWARVPRDPQVPFEEIGFRCVQN